MFLNTLTVMRGSRLTLFVGVLVLAIALYVSRAEALSAGQSVVGTGLLPSAPNLIISTSGGNDVAYIEALQSPVAYGGTSSGFDAANACAGPDTIADLGTGTFVFTTKKHQYSFGFYEAGRLILAGSPRLG